MFYFHPFPFSNVEHVINLSKIGSAADIAKTSKITPPSNLTRMPGLDDLSITTKPPAYSSMPAGTARRTSAGNEFSSRNVSTRKVADSPTTPKPARDVTPEKLQQMKETRSMADRIGDKEYSARIGKQIDEIEANPPKSVRDLPDGEIKKTAQDLETPKGQKEIKDKLDADPEAKKAVEDGAKKIDEEVKKPAWKDLPESEKMARIQKYATYAGIGLAAATLMGMYIKAKIDSDRINNTEYKIKSIRTGESTTVTVTYEPNDKFTMKDTVTISNSNSDPKVDGDAELKSTSNGMIKFEGKKLKVAGDSGTLRCSTTLGNLFGQSVGNVTKSIGQGAGSAVGGAVGGAAESLYDTLVPKGLQEFISKTWISSVVVSIIIVLIVIGIFLMSLYRSYA